MHHLKDINVLIADDHPVFRKGCGLMLKNTPGINIVGEACSGGELIALSCKLQPDVILTDIKMPGQDGISATEELMKLLPGCRIIALSMFDRDDYIAAIIRAGAKGYLLKDAEISEIVSAIKTVFNGGTYYSKNITPRLTRIISDESHRGELSERERQVIKLLCAELSSKQIASDLNVSKRTVDWYKEKIFEKLSLKNSAGIIAYAMKNNICGD